MASPQSVWFAGGGSGGHLQPLRVLRDGLARRRPDLHLPLLVSGRGVERRFLLEDDIKLELFPNRSSRPSWREWSSWARALRRVRRFAAEFPPVCIVSGGGYVSLTVGLACPRVPVVQIEPDRRPGKSARVLRARARRVFTQWPEGDPRGRVVDTGMPLAIDPELSRDEARRRLELPRDALVLGVVGGSQGARAIDQRMLRGAGELRAVPGIRVMHVAGEERVEALVGAYRHAGVVARVRSFERDMSAWYGACDLIVARGGGMTVAEISAMGRAALFVPYPHHRDRHQERNAEVLVAAKAGWMVLERDADEHTFVRDHVVPLLLQPSGLQQCAQRARALGRREGSLLIGDWLSAFVAGSSETVGFQQSPSSEGGSDGENGGGEPADAPASAAPGGDRGKRHGLARGRAAGAG